ncbi:Meiotic recombination protein rec12 [Tolypocladium ophioglossoides CBS 100239]|uniref:DNA topoisomerase (ATP-hydrolyzing) n=1 Tax=Tolypocladium ophioglossoides (strain CBS 100239) TaxID=1163406 RepID=A0A0L0NHC1_TOLOC|nr:Meiotic recombination protein rec12 [Tolypocladium ophioglossoides CBS 100239]
MDDNGQQSVAPAHTHRVRRERDGWDGQPTSPSRASTATGALITCMESLLESILDRLSEGKEISISWESRRSLHSRNGESRRQELRFPGRSLSEGQKFARILLILQLSHDALVSGTILTKRNIFYQHQDLFDNQRVVDELVDDLALTLGVNRDDLNIVASAKGLVHGPMTIRLHDGTAIDASLGDTGTPIPVARSISAVDYSSIRWVLVVEKDAIFRTLSSSQFWRTSTVGPGLIITASLLAKGYPDLTTRSFLHLIHEQRLEMPIFVLTDFDPDGVNIFRCYRFGSDALAHESTAYNPGVRWLGVRARHVHDFDTALKNHPPPIEGPSNGSQSSASSRASIASTTSRDPICRLTSRDRKAVKWTLEKAFVRYSEDPEMVWLRRELQVMLMMGIKAEIQWLDDAGNITEWLDRNIAVILSSDSPF